MVPDATASNATALIPVTPLLLWEAFLFTLALFIFVIVVVNIIQKSGRKYEGIEAFTHSFPVRLIFDEKNNHSSLSLFQFMAWTFVVAFTFCMIYFMRIVSGIQDLPPVPVYLLGLMGISAMVPLASTGVTELRRSAKSAQGLTFREPRFNSMLEEDGRPSFSRFQMFLWTMAGLGIYVVLFIRMLTTAGMMVWSLALPDLDPVLLGLMGVSQFGYVGGKYFSGTYTGTPESSETGSRTEPVQPRGPKVFMPAIGQVFPRKGKEKEPVTITGTNFGTTKDTIFLNEQKIPDTAVTSWSDKRIEFTVPAETAAGKYLLRVSTQSGLSNQVEFWVVSEELYFRKRAVDAFIDSKIFIDQVNNTSPPPKGFIINKPYHFFYHFRVPANTPRWGVRFATQLYVNDVFIEEKEFEPGHLSGENYGIYTYKFTKSGPYRIEIRGANEEPVRLELTVGSG
jgi:hypothetical protein